MIVVVLFVSFVVVVVLIIVIVSWNANRFERVDVYNDVCYLI